MGSSHCEELGKSSQADNEEKPTDGNQRKQSRKQCISTLTNVLKQFLEFVTIPTIFIWIYAALGRVPVKTVHDNEEAIKKRFFPVYFLAEYLVLIFYQE